MLELRPVSTDQVATLASAVDGAVHRIGVTYEIRGPGDKFTSYDAATGGSMWSTKSQNDYSTARQLIKQYQEDDGAVKTGTSVKAEYAYDTTASTGVFTTGLRLTTLS